MLVNTIALLYLQLQYRPYTDYFDITDRIRLANQSYLYRINSFFPAHTVN